MSNTISLAMVVTFGFVMSWVAFVAEVTEAEKAKHNQEQIVWTTK